MKPDVLTLAAVIFVVGLLASGLGVTEVFQEEPQPRLAELQQAMPALATEAEKAVR